MAGEFDERGITSLMSRYSVAESAERIKAALKAKGLTLFAVIDQSREAEKVGLVLRPTILIIFGDPKAGTPLMEGSPTLAIDLPLKALIWEDSSGACAGRLQQFGVLAAAPCFSASAVLGDRRITVKCPRIKCGCSEHPWSFTLSVALPNAADTNRLLPQAAALGE